MKPKTGKTLKPRKRQKVTVFQTLQIPIFLLACAALCFYLQNKIAAAILIALAFYHISINSMPSLLNLLSNSMILSAKYKEAEKISLFGIRWCALLKLEGVATLPRSFAWDCMFKFTLSQAYLQQARFEESYNVEKELLDLLELHRDYNGAAKVRGNLAFCLIAMGKLTQAEAMLDKAIQFLEAGLRGAERENDIKAQAYRARLCSALFEKAILHETKRDFDVAEKIRRKALVEAEILGKNGNESGIMSHLCMLAKCLCHLGKYTEAEELARKVCEYRSKTMHDDHVLLASARQGLGRILCATDQFEEAQKLLEKALKSAQISVGAEHPDIPTFKSDLAKLRIKQNRLQEAETLLNSAIEHTEKTQGKDHPNIIEYLLALEELKIKEGDSSQANIYKDRANELLCQVRQN